MQGYSKGYLGRYLTVHYNGNIESSIQGYSKDRLGALYKSPLEWFARGLHAGL
jgi:hypothetical protein